MIGVLDTEVKPDYRYLGPEIAHHLPNADYRVFVDDPTLPDLHNLDGIVLSGSTASVYENNHDGWLKSEMAIVERCIEEKLPLLGICFGHQVVNVALGGTVKPDRRRATFVEMDYDDDDAVLKGVGPVVPVLHADLVTELGKGMQSTASTDYNAHFCARHRESPLWTVQFHPEFTVRVADKPSDFDPGEYSFDQTNAVRVLQNFADVCEQD
jgi:GMP synthase (glutamine-hydrolysing)